MKVFVSYSHKDSRFVDKLIDDLVFANISVTYDKWLLNIGYSIIYKISEYVSEANKIIVVLSSNSIESNWVKKELAIAMTSEINVKAVKVIPIVLDNCEIPAIIADKLYADFRNNNRYFNSLRQIISSVKETIDDRFESIFERRDNLEKKLSTLIDYLNSNDIENTKKYLIKIDYFLAALLGHLWQVLKQYQT